MIFEIAGIALPVWLQIILGLVLLLIGIRYLWTF